MGKEEMVVLSDHMSLSSFGDSGMNVRSSTRTSIPIMLKYVKYTILSGQVKRSIRSLYRSYYQAASERKFQLCLEGGHAGHVFVSESRIVELYTIMSCIVASLHSLLVNIGKSESAVAKVPHVRPFHMS